MPTNYPCYLSILGDSSIDHFQTLPTHLSFCEARKVLPTKLLLLSSFLLPIYGVLLLLPLSDTRFCKVSLITELLYYADI